MCCLRKLKFPCVRTGSPDFALLFKLLTVQSPATSNYFFCFVLHKTAQEVGYISSAVCTNADCSLHKEGECLIFLNLSKLFLMLHICRHIKHKISKYVLTHTVQKYLLPIQFSLDRFIWSIQLISVKLKLSKVSIPSQPRCQSKVRSLSSVS